MGAREYIGHCRCPLCANAKARVGVSASGLTYITCNACNSQVFGRSDRSDELIRGLIVKETPPPDPPPAPPAPGSASEEGTLPKAGGKTRNPWEIY